MPLPDILKKITSGGSHTSAKPKVPSSKHETPPYDGSLAERPKSLLLALNFSENPGSSAVSEAGTCYDGDRITTPMVCTSRLCKTLREMLHDTDAVGQMIKYLQTRKAEHILRFWLDAESFKASASSRLHSQRIKSSHVSPCSPSKNGTSTSTTQPKPTSNHHSSNTVTSPLNHPTPALLADATAVNTAGGCAAAAVMHNTHAAASHPCDTGAPSCVTSSSGTLRANVPGTGTSHQAKSSAAPRHSSDNSGTNFQCEKQSDRTSSTASSRGRPTCNDTLTGVRSADYQSNVVDRVSSSGSAGLDNDMSRRCVPTTDAGPCRIGDGRQMQSGTTHQPITDAAAGGGAVAGASTSGDSAASQQPTPTAQDDKLTIRDKMIKSIEEDAVSIYSRYISHDATTPIGVSDDIRSHTISSICTEQGLIDIHCFTKAQEFAVFTLESRYYQPFLQSDQHCQHQINLLTSTKIHLSDIIYHENSLFYFMEYMEQEGVSYLLQCLLAMDNYQRHLSESSPHINTAQAQSDAMIIYDKYFSLQAHQPLGFDDRVRFEVEANICREGGPLPDLFSTPKAQVLQTIEKLYFKSFLESDMYMRYLNELVTTVNTPHTETHKRTESDSVSEHSVGSNHSDVNTLLSGAGQVNKAMNKLKLTEQDMRIDTNTFDPDTLWQRQQSGNMVVGQVDSVGRYLSCLDPEPDEDRKKKGFFTKLGEKTKSQELMALQVAQMIIDDVTNLTSQSQEQDEDT